MSIQNLINYPKTMNKKELLEKYLLEEVEVLEPNYVVDYISNEYSKTYISPYTMTKFSIRKIKQLNLDRLIDLLAQYVKVEDIVEKNH